MKHLIILFSLFFIQSPLYTVDSGNTLHSTSSIQSSLYTADSDNTLHSTYSMQSSTPSHNKHSTTQYYMKNGTFHDILECPCHHCLDMKIGAMIVAGFRGYTTTPMIIQAIEQYHIGGVIYFDVDVSNSFSSRNIQSPEQLSKLSDSLQSFAGENYPLFIAIDQEGGMVNRLKTRYGFPSSSSAWEIGRIGDTVHTRREMAIMANTLVKAGMNLNFAPCVDIAINPLNPIIAGKKRAFSADADSVTLHSRVVIEEMNRARILTSLKHFPGHGSSHADSHLGLVDITKQWKESELQPYNELIEEGYRQIVMVGHLINHTIDSLPASLSEKTLQGLLREEMGFEGVIATDDMNMGAIVDHYSLEQALYLSITAGVNMIILGNNGKRFEPDLIIRSHTLIKSMVKDGRIPIKLINDSYRRLSALKKEFL